MLLAAKTALLRAQGRQSSTKNYFTVTLGGPVPFFIQGTGAGIATATADLSQPISNNTEAWGIEHTPFGGWRIVGNLQVPVSIPVTATTGDVINVAWDAVTGDLFLGINGTYYDVAGTSLGGTPSMPAFIGLTGTMFQFGGATETTNDMTLDSAPGDTPSGFANWDSGSTWNPADKSSNAVLSGGNLILNAGTVIVAMARGTVSKTSP